MTRREPWVPLAGFVQPPEPGSVSEGDDLLPPAPRRAPDEIEQQEAPLAERNEQVRARVRELLGKYPTLKSRQLYDMAVRLDPTLEQEGLRTFHARYVLPVRREQAVAEGRMRKPRKRTRPVAEAKPAEAARAETSPRRGPRRQATPPAVSAADMAAERDRVREVLLRFAREVAAAESRAELVSAVSRADEFAGEIMRPPKVEPTGEEST